MFLFFSYLHDHLSDWLPYITRFNLYTLTVTSLVRRFIIHIIGFCYSLSFKSFCLFKSIILSTMCSFYATCFVLNIDPNVCTFVLFPTPIYYKSYSYGH